jgi:hypothetical protein
MVHVRIEGNRVDGSIETVWRYHNHLELQDKAQKNIRNRAVKSEGGLTTLVTMERNWGGAWVKVAHRITVLPPLGYVTEFTEGPLAGSKMFTVFTPIDGEHTQIDLYGEFRSPVMKDAEVESAARRYLEEVQTSDAPAIKELQHGPREAA